MQLASGYIATANPNPALPRCIDETSNRISLALHAKRIVDFKLDHSVQLGLSREGSARDASVVTLSFGTTQLTLRSNTIVLASNGVLLFVND